jgi:N-acyl amino acid synthase of PEP-CTERM/exosortase system
LVDTSVTSLRDTFGTRFEIVPALSAALRDEAFRIRHQVYCEDLNFEAPRSDGREIDEYDAHSIQLLIRHVSTGEYIGCARVIRPNPLDPLVSLPFERTCEDALDRSMVDPRALPRDKIAEVSRLAVISRYRRRKGEAPKPFPVSEEDFGSQNQPRFPYILVGMYLGVVAVSIYHAIDNLFVLTEPRLAQHFFRLGIEIKQIGDPVEHRGIRIPSVIRLDKMVEGLNRFVKPLYVAVSEGVRRAYTNQA